MKKHKNKVVTISGDKLKKLTEKIELKFDALNGPEIKITAASIKDALCNYSFEITDGVNAGDTHAVKGKGLVDDDMFNAFAKLNVHLAVIDDVFKHSGVEITSINKFHSNELTHLYTVTGFKMKRSADDFTVILIGNKSISSAAGRIELESPKILLDKFSSYDFHKDLKTSLERAIEEVELYKNGKCTPVEAPSEDEQIKNQGTLELSEADGDAEFEKGKV